MCRGELVGQAACMGGIWLLVCRHSSHLLINGLIHPVRLRCFRGGGQILETATQVEKHTTNCSTKNRSLHEYRLLPAPRPHHHAGLCSKSQHQEQSTLKHSSTRTHLQRLAAPVLSAIAGIKVLLQPSPLPKVIHFFYVVGGQTATNNKNPC